MSKEKAGEPMELTGDELDQVIGAGDAMPIDYPDIGGGSSGGGKKVKVSGGGKATTGSEAGSSKGVVSSSSTPATTTTAPGVNILFEGKNINAQR